MLQAILIFVLCLAILCSFLNQFIKYVNRRHHLFESYGTSQCTVCVCSRQNGRRKSCLNDFYCHPEIDKGFELIITKIIIISFSFSKDVCLCVLRCRLSTALCWSMHRLHLVQVSHMPRKKQHDKYD